MEYIKRELEPHLISLFQNKKATGLIVAGVIGCGKTTLIQQALKTLEKNHKIFCYTGDDATFRNAVSLDTQFI